MAQSTSHHAIEEIFSIYIRIGEQPSYEVTKALGQLVGETPNRVLQMFFQAVRRPGDGLNAGTG